MVQIGQSSVAWAMLRVLHAVTSGYQIALSGYHLREEQELRRLREERWLATLLEVERSHIPFPDEPPVEFPSDAVVRRMTRGTFKNWRELSKYRISRYAIGEFGVDVPGQMFKLRDTLNATSDAPLIPSSYRHARYNSAEGSRLTAWEKDMAPELPGAPVPSFSRSYRMNSSPNSASL